MQPLEPDSAYGRPCVLSHSPASCNQDAPRPTVTAMMDFTLSPPSWQGIKQEKAEAVIDLTGSPERESIRQNLDPACVAQMKDWLERNMHHPYPSPSTVSHFAEAAGVLRSSIIKWFSNQRMWLRKTGRLCGPDKVNHRHVHRRKPQSAVQGPFGLSDTFTRHMEQYIATSPDGEYPPHRIIRLFAREGRVSTAVIRKWFCEWRRRNGRARTHYQRQQAQMFAASHRLWALSDQSWAPQAPQEDAGMPSVHTTSSQHIPSSGFYIEISPVDDHQPGLTVKQERTGSTHELDL